MRWSVFVFYRCDRESFNERERFGMGEHEKEFAASEWDAIRPWIEGLCLGGTLIRIDITPIWAGQ